MERAGAGWDQHWEEIRACLLSWWKGLCFPKQLTANGLITLPMCSHTDSSRGATFPGMQTATQALSVTSFSIFILCKVMTIPSGARVCPRPDEGTRFCHKNIFYPIIIGQMRNAERREISNLGFDQILSALLAHSPKCTEPRTGSMANKSTWFLL